MDRYDEALNAFRAGDNERASIISSQWLAEARADADVPAQVEATCMLARVALRNGDLDEVKSCADEARDLALTSPDAALQRVPLHLQAVQARLSGDAVRARRLYGESIALNLSLGREAMVAAEYHNLAYVELHDGQTERAKELFLTARALAVEENLESLLAELVADAAVVASLSGQPEHAATLLGACVAQYEAHGRVPDPDDQLEHDRLRVSLAAALGSKDFDEAYAAGKLLGPREALAQAEQSDAGGLEPPSANSD